ncbi:undecaprenyl-diphosphatase [Brevibacillus laterosporus]|uniref:undecaprenyl-diphosphatase n=1 Tax=Brevibacillus laterosporus TaxID=1465 RepID=UPI00215CBF3A|nr:undecaprenyl-diphosphatase [Brevibacillus laterosporus]MCR8940005.1 undecaprenyl-diphosphatase [Brevibacillus laterosporus]MCZ0842645.1 undecaprenyl-diphosphatase [Brevibacillus laterosporus]MCZ0846536.1 undecaprenyl-diphosphatase [Brevibacillus laterosporus]MED1912214.1 undecaprenyl-diphosphatase [Brevibacillus laterosporus]
MESILPYLILNGDKIVRIGGGFTTPTVYNGERLFDRVYELEEITLDSTVVQALSSFAGSYSVVGWISIFLAKYAEYLFYLSIPVYWFFGNRKNKRMIIQTIIVCCISMGISWLLGQLILRERPFVTLPLTPLVPHDADASFPSDHATAALAIAATYWYYIKPKGRRFWMILAVGVSLSRVFIGVHYPTDVLSGMVLGMSCAYVIHRLLPKFPRVVGLIDEGILLYEKMESAIIPPKKSASRKRHHTIE